MERFEIAQDEEQLTLTLPAPPGRMAFGFLLLFFTIACLTPLGILGVLQDTPSRRGLVPAGSLGFTDPHTNHFGFLWLVGFGLILIALPVFALKTYRACLVFRFDRAAGRVTRNGRVVAPLRRIEAIRVLRTEDADDQPLYKLSVLHSDGFLVPIDEGYDEEEI